MREFAVRVALGASPQQVLAVVLKNGFEFALAGTAFGALLSFWASEGVKGMFYGILITDPIALVIAEVTLLAVAMIASIVPALRAARADPVEVLRAT
jgi:ABC-type antimicrobial peptide transport system permease subunit